MKRLAICIVAFCSLCYSPPPLPAQDEATYPAPVSEYAEQTGPNTMTFLSYPKYYRNTSGDLTEVDTTLVESSNPDWDYEVTTGIWTLRVRTDGTFQAEHEENIFSYRLNSIGLGRGNGYKPFQWGEPNWSNVIVQGDTIRWSDIFPDVDLSVRYIHDILKVDVILQRALMDRIRADVNNGYLNREEYLTARFDIPNALVTGEARQGGRIRDIFAEPFELNQPLEILKHDKVVHKIRPVETYVIDDQGREIMMDESPIRSAQWWQLRKNGPGVAEMSALLGDMADAPEGGVVMDPTSYFTTYGAYNVATMDAELAYQSSTNLGGATQIILSSSDRAVLACDLSGLSYNKAVTNIRLKIFLHACSAYGAYTVQAFNTTKAWWEAGVDWYESDSGIPWVTAGGDYTEENPGLTTTIQTSSPFQRDFAYVDLTRPFNARYPYFSEINVMGYLLKITGPGDLTFLSKEWCTTSERWLIEVTYYPDARTQSVWHRPFLKRRDGNKALANDRWFPIGWYLGIEDHEPTAWGYTDDNITNLADGYNDGASSYYDTYIYNAFNAQPWIEQRNKLDYSQVWGCGVSASGFPGFFSEIKDFHEALNTLKTVYDTTYGDGQRRDYYLLPAVAHTLNNIDGTWLHEAATTTYDTTVFSGVSSATKYIAEDSCSSFSFTWTDEEDSLGKLVAGIKNYPSTNPRVRGWNFDEEQFAVSLDNPSHRAHIRERIQTYNNIVWANDNNPPGKFPINTIDTHDNFYISYAPDPVEGEKIVKADAGKIADMNLYNYIFEDYSYYHDIYSQRANDDWVDAVYMAECAVRYTNVGFCRMISVRNWPPTNPVYTPSHIEDGNNMDKYRFLPYSSWAVGGQGLLIWSLPHNETPGWFKYCHQIARETYAMKDYLMNSPALDIPAIIYDNTQSQRLRFILRKNQNNPTNQVLLLFCNFSYDGGNHITYVYFPNHAISNVSYITPDNIWPYQIIDNNHTFKYDPTDMVSPKDVYARAYFVTLN